MAWDEARDAELRRLAADGYSASQAAMSINDRFGESFTRNAAIGRAARMKPPVHWKIKGRPGTRHKRRAKPSRPGPLPDVAPPAHVERAIPEIQPLPKIQPPPLERDDGKTTTVEIVLPARTTILDLDGGTCRWPMWGYHERPTIASPFCGELPTDGLPYCTYHSRMAYSGAPPDPRRSNYNPQHGRQTR